MKKPKKGSGFLLLAIVLLLFVNVFAQKSSDEILLENVEKYLNKICFFDRIFLNMIVEKISRTDDVYVCLNDGMLVKLILSDELLSWIDFKHIENAVIYIASAYFLVLENESELAGRIAHELAHLSSLYDREHQPNPDEEILEREMAADRAAILVLKKMGYKPEAVADFLGRILSEYSDEISWSKKTKKLFAYRYLAAKKLTEEIYNSEPRKKYKEYLYFTETQFKVIKKIVKYLQDKSGK